MASKRPLKLTDWGISWEEYKELTYFCLQYDRKRREADALLTLKLSTPTPETYHRNGREYGTFMPHGSGHTSDPTAMTAERRERMLKDVRMIEQAAQLAGRLDDGYDISKPLLKAVTTRSGVQSVMAHPNTRPPCGKNLFYAARRKFFWILREMKNGEF